MIACLWIATGAVLAGADEGALAWDARAAEHLLSRAGFGARSDEIERAVERGLDATVDELLAGEPFVEHPFYARLRAARGMGAQLAQMEPDERHARMTELRRDDRAQVEDFLAWWMERVLEGTDPLRERMTLFWHGYFTSSMKDVQNSQEMILQNQFLRTNALARFGVLVHGIARDPAMLEYLDNATSRRGRPNENFARELMELFTLGEGNYTEEDVKEAARAFTGWTDRYGRFRFDRDKHDRGSKTVLGHTGNLNGDEVIDVLLGQEACARHLARALLEYFEGLAPDEERERSYAERLRASGLDVGAFLAALFRDPVFYRDAVVGTRIAGPVDHLVGISRRLGAEPPAELLLAGAAMLGQRLFDPPNVKGWEEGTAWITTSTLIQRANLAGMLLGQLRPADFRVAPEEDLRALGDSDETSERRAVTPASRELRTLARLRWRPRLNLGQRFVREGAARDRQVIARLCDELLAAPVGSATQRGLEELLRAERDALGIEEGRLLERPDVAEAVLRRVAHVVLSLPEAQLH